MRASTVVASTRPSRSHHVVALLLALACSTAAVINAGSTGVDVSSAVTQAEFECLASQHNVSYVVVRAYRSVGSVDSAAAGTVAAAKAAGINEIHTYHFPDVRQDPVTQVKTCLAYLAQNDIAPTRYWLDIEEFAWPSNVTANVDFIQAMATTASAGGMGVGVYSGKRSWVPITGDSHVLGDLPLWYAHYQQPPDPSFDDFVPYGGWKTPSYKQYMGDATWCGADVDVNWRP